MRRLPLVIVAATAALAATAPAALAHHDHPDRRDRPDSPGLSHRGPDRGIGAARLRIEGVVAAPATATGVPVTVTAANGPAGASLAGATGVAVKIDPTTHLRKRGVDAPTVADLKPGDRVRVSWEAAATPANLLPAARSISDQGPPPPVRYTLRGTVAGAASAVGVPVTLTGAGRRISAAVTGAGTVAVKLDPTTLILKRGTFPATAAALVPGDRVKVVIEAPPGANPLDAVAKKVKDYGPPPPVRFQIRGTVAADAAPAGLQVSVSAANRHAQKALGAIGSALVRLDATTAIRKRGLGRTSYAELRAGDRVAIVWWAPRGTALAGLPAAHRVRDLGPAR